MPLRAALVASVLVTGLLAVGGCDAAGAGAGPAGDDHADAVDGSWRDTGLHHFTEHAALLPDGRVMLWGWFDSDQRPAIWDPTTGALSRIPGPPGDDVLFHSGHVFLPDGRLLLAGGGNLQRLTRTFDPGAPASVTPWGELGGRLATPRFYPTAVVLGSGAVLVASGDFLTGPEGIPSPGLAAEIYDPAQDRWVPIVDRSQADERLPSIDVYPTMFALPSGRLIYLPAAEGFSDRVAAPAILELDGPRVTSDSFGAVEVDGEVVEAPSTTGGWQPLPIELERRERGAAVLLVDDTGTRPIPRILLAGGGDSSELVDLTDERHPTVTRASLAFPRGEHTELVPLPTGDVLVFDGNARVPQPPELFHGGAWKVTAPPPRFGRANHAEAVLLADGRVLLSSDGLLDEETGERAVDQTIEVFSPAFTAAARPRITSSPKRANARSTITIGVSVDPDDIASVSLLRPTSVTHGTDSSQRLVELASSAGGQELRVRMPAADTAPPGDYLLHVVDRAGVPSIGRFLRLE